MSKICHLVIWSSVSGEQKAMSMIEDESPLLHVGVRSWFRTVREWVRMISSSSSPLRLLSSYPHSWEWLLVSAQMSTSKLLLREYSRAFCRWEKSEVMSQ